MCVSVSVVQPTINMRLATKLLQGAKCVASVRVLFSGHLQLFSPILGYINFVFKKCVGIMYISVHKYTVPYSSIIRSG